MRGVLSAVPTQEGVVVISLARGVEVIYVGGDVLKGEAVPQGCVIGVAVRHVEDQPTVR